MAQRYGGKYSPEPREDDGRDTVKVPPPGPYSGRRRTRAGGRVNVLFFAPFAFLLTGFQKDPAGLALNLVAFGLLILAAWLTREGIRAQEAYEARNIARRPAIPRKLFASVITGAGLFVGGIVPGGSWFTPVVYGVLGAVVHFLAFGPDPMKDKGMAGVDRYENDRVARAVDAAEKHLEAMRDAILRAGDRQLEQRVDRFANAARLMFRRIEEDPRDLTASRKYLSVYLQGAEDATAKFADLYARSRDAKARQDYEALLNDLEANFTARTEYLLGNDRSDLDVEIEVLRERLAREGVKAD